MKKPSKNINIFKKIGEGLCDVVYMRFYVVVRVSLIAYIFSI